MPWKWKPNLTFWKKDIVKQHKRTERIAQQCYRNRLLQKREGDAENDWEIAAKIAQSPLRQLLFSSSCLWIKVKPLVPIGLIFSATAIGFTWWLEHETEIRQRTTSQNLNHQRIFESYISNIKEISLSNDYKDTVELLEERIFIRGMTLPVLRELTHDDERKAQLVLFLYQLQMCEMVSERKCKELEISRAEKLSSLNQAQEIDEEIGQAQQSPEQQESQEVVKNERAPKILQTADLKFSKFKGYQLPDISFLGADLRGANLESADLTNANLISANLSCHQRSIQAWWSWIPLPIEDAQDVTCASLRKAKLQDTNFVGADLRGIDLGEANLSGANLQFAKITTSEVEYQIETPLGKLLKIIWLKPSKKITQANLSSANLSGANLNQVDLTDANLSKAIMLDVDLSEVQGLTRQQLEGDNPPLLCHVDFSNIHEVEFPQDNFQNRDCLALNGIDLSEANLSKLNLTETNLQDVNFESTNLTETNFQNANLQNANLQNANLQNANLTETNFQDANLQNTNLQNADFQNANLSQADLNSTNLIGANFNGANLSDANLSKAIILGIDLRQTEGIKQELLDGDNPPLLCNVALPREVDDNQLKDRDCDAMANTLLQRYPQQFSDLKTAKLFLSEQRTKIRK